MRTSGNNHNQPNVARLTIEAIIHRYLWMTERTDPRSREVVKRGHAGQDCQTRAGAEHGG